MEPSPATSSQGKSSGLGEVLGSRKHKFSAAFRDFFFFTLFYAFSHIVNFDCDLQNIMFCFVFPLPLTLSNKIKRGHSAVLSLSFGKVFRHGAL